MTNKKVKSASKSKKTSPPAQPVPKAEPEIVETQSTEQVPSVTLMDSCRHQAYQAP